MIEDLEAPARQPSLKPSDLTEPQMDLYRRITEGPRSGGAFELTDADGALRGPFGGFLLSPDLGDALQQLGAAVRYRSNLTPRVSELAILAVAAHHRSKFERYAHEAVGRKVGLSEAEMEAINRGEVPTSLDSIEAAAVRFAMSALGGDVDDATWTECVPPLTVEHAFELIVLVGYYSTLALQLKVLRSDVVS
ncbi:carboxymuconolactone decarboxylase family protein [Rhodococcus erythropolis]|uniref:carboxymuconolactone decarboxylase family protein n=1 Tax=Rhodococcus erythropolis TaxID=1833 RepID=UPI001BECD9B3|nr:carboxymuconolactone decarboxylase family protein [Rhodococcus erythropolis]MBT2266117.1 carboxymuconolactone decarboxylase family protein [Rhodococcus erythropolis]